MTLFKNMVIRPFMASSSSDRYFNTNSEISIGFVSISIHLQTIDTGYKAKILTDFYNFTEK
jgi:hypothetical protein